MTTACESAMRALLKGHFRDWNGLPGECSLSAIDRLLGGSTVLDAHVGLGDDRTSCTRSSMNEAPLLVWHRGERVLLVELDLLSAPMPAPELGNEAVGRLDVPWGPGTLDGGEWVLPDRGLALVVTPNRRVVACLGFAPTTVERYVAELRPRRELTVLPPNWPRGEEGGS